MAVVRAIHGGARSTADRVLFERIGEFLFDQRLAPEPTNFAFAHRLLGDPDGPLASAVAALTRGGVRLTQRDVDMLTREANQTVAVSDDRAQRTEGLVAKTQMQVEGFADMVTAIHAETEGFGRDLAAGAAAIRGACVDGGPAALLIDEVVRITTRMQERAQTAEARLAAATREARELRKKLEEARENARRDPLTDLPNRRAFEEAYAAQSAAGASICVAVCDVDHFKSVNDRFGHAVGDRVLKVIGDILASTCAGHLVARYGGEEFAVLFTGVQPSAAAATLDTARTTVAAKRYRLRDTDAPLGEITFSAGLTAAGRDEGFCAVFQRADQLLYAAKSSGRNRVHHEWHSSPNNSVARR